VAELAWLREPIEEVRSGRLRYPLAPGSEWRPADDDPGWQMATDRERYRVLLGR
jgi:hypothetical protein